jgi:hypothetical protein
MTDWQNPTTVLHEYGKSRLLHLYSKTFSNYSPSLVAAWVKLLHVVDGIYLYVCFVSCWFPPQGLIELS